MESLERNVEYLLQAARTEKARALVAPGEPA